MQEIATSPGEDAAARSHAGFGGHPPGLSALFFTELWERFSYYGMRALLVLFMVAPAATGGLGFATTDAGRIYGTYTFAVYMLAIPGGYLADALLGARRSVLVGGTIIALGHFTLAIASEWTFYLGLLLIALGTGLFKPNISVMVGSLYKPDDERRDAGFSIFYWGVNIGAFIAPLVTGFLAQSDTFKSWLAAAGFDPALSWHWGFAAAGIGMTIAMLIFVRRGGPIAEIGAPPAVASGVAMRMALVIAAALALFGLVWLSDRPGLESLRWIFVAAPIVAALRLAWSGDVGTRRLAAVAVFFLAAMGFWAIFEQAGVSIALFADELTQREIGGYSIPSAWFQALNPLFVILLAPIFAWGWMRLGVRQPSSPVKFVLGLAFLALSFLLMVPAAMMTAAGKVSPLWLVGLFFLQTVGELCLSPVGLSTMTKLAPVKYIGLVLGAWFLAAALGNKLAGVLGGAFSSSDAAGMARFFGNQAILVGLGTLLLLAMVPWLKRLMGGIR